jgi:hypothetical protein
MNDAEQQTRFRRSMMCGWTALVVFASIFYLTGSLAKAVVVAVYVYVSSTVGLGHNWIFKGGFLVSVVAIAVYVGAIPPPAEWSGYLKELQTLLANSFH